MTKKDTFTYRDNKTASAVIFLHGFTGDLRKTWGDFPWLLIAKPGLNDWDVFSVGYKSTLLTPELRWLWKAAPDIQRLADTLATRIRNVFKRYNRIAFVAHSMGGLVVQRALLDCKDTRRRTSHVFLFGTPSNGLVKAVVGTLFTAKRQVRDMAVGGPFITRLRRDWEEKIGRNHFPFYFRSVAGEEDEFVPANSAHDCFPQESCDSISGGHLEIVKPASPDHLAVRIVLEGLLQGRPAEKPPQEVGTDPPKPEIDEPIPPALSVDPASLEIPTEYREWLARSCEWMHIDNLYGVNSEVNVSLPKVFIPLYAAPPRRGKEAKDGNGPGPDESGTPKAGMLEKTRHAISSS